jgi:uncharacterized membrane protein
VIEFSCGFRLGQADEVEAESFYVLPVTLPAWDVLVMDDYLFEAICWVVLSYFVFGCWVLINY